jgi:DNA polymerase-3 subunit gamma/tau
MSYQVIARKYRPQRFSDVVGQEHVSQTLANAIAQKRIAHAYLFVGPRGTGKTTTARIFAKCLNCTNGPSVDFDDNDPRCVEITEGRSMDVLEIDGASNNGVEQVRELRETCKYAPATSRYKIYIIDEVHMLSTSAFNALLKTLEEPPAHVKFLFATTEAEKVLPTILSRCQRFDLRRIPAALIVKHLAHIAKEEGIKIDDAALHAIARGADGGMRDAESTLDQLISFCGEEIAEADVLSMFGLAARSQILALAGALLAGDVETVLRELNDLAKGGKDLGRLLGDLLNHFRNLLIYQVSKGDLKLLEVSEAEAVALGEQAKLAGADALTRVMEVLTDCEGRFRDAASKKILIEVGLLKAVQARNAVPLDAVLKQLQQLRAEGGGTSGGSSGGGAPEPAPAPAPAPSRPSLLSAFTAAAAPTPAAPPPSAPRAMAPPPPPPAPAPISAPEPRPVAPAAAVTSEITGQALEELWERVSEAVGRASPFTKTYLVEAHPVSFVKNLFTIGFDPEYADHLGLVDNAKNRTIIQTKLHELGYAQAFVKFIKAEAPPHRVRPAVVAAPTPTLTPTTAPAAKSPGEAKKAAPISLNKDDFKNDPLIKKALEIFKGQIVDVRV